LEKVGFTRREPVTVRFIRMSPGVQSTLDYVSKLSRQPSHIYRLIEDGKKQGRKFLKSLAKKEEKMPAPTRLERFAGRAVGLVVKPIQT
ncbi:MAG TPA: hypothetical protein VNZ22_02505, partial [Bacillota bacterium]|nr:hypothetical protein [Bacillota bacterium]